MKKNLYVVLFSIVCLCATNTLKAQIISTIAGNGMSGISGDGAAALQQNYIAHLMWQ